MGNTPNIRFKGFTDDWEQRKLGDIFEQTSNLVNPKVDEIELWSLTVEDGLIKKSDRYNREFLVKKDDNFKEVRPGDIVYNPMNMTLGAVGYNGMEKSVAVSGYYTTMVTKDNYDSYYINTWLKSPQAILLYQTYATGSLIEKQRVQFPTLSIIPVAFPKYEEQVKIGNCFKSIDHLITLHQRKCDETKKLKKFMLQKMFPKKDAKKPEIRFAGFTDDWEQRKLGDWGDFYYGRSCPKWSVTEDATIPCIRYGELYTKFGAKIDRVYSYTNMPPENLRFSKGTEVLIPRVGEDPMDYNHCTWLSMKDVAIGEMISVFNTDNNPLFTATMFNATLQNEFAMRVEGGSVTNLYFEKLKNIDVSFPSIREQEMIAAYFENIDNLITLHQRKCDELKELKKYMLQNMFPQKG